MNKTIALRVTIGAALTLIAGIAPAHKQAPVAVEKRYSDQGVIDCIRKGTGTLDARLADLKRKEIASKKSLTSIEPIVLERRRIEEQWCSIEARCLADAVPRHREHFYGLTLSTCLEN